jgi:hypothetical protein
MPRWERSRGASAPRSSFVSLECFKALVDSERIITRLRAEGYEIAHRHDGADLVVVKTCGFLEVPSGDRWPAHRLGTRRAGPFRFRINRS